MMFWLGFFVGLGAASFLALVVATAMSCAPTGDDEEQPNRLFDLRAQEAGR